MGHWRHRAIAAVIAIGLGTAVSLPAQAGAFTFYLNMKPGCYSYTSPTLDTYPLEGSKYKTLFRGSCNAPHHLQVIFAGIVKAKARTATEDEVFALCKSKYKKHMGSAAPTTIQSSRPYLNYYWPDAGLERLKYSNKVVCYIHGADETYDNYVTLVEEY